MNQPPLLRWLFRQLSEHLKHRQLTGPAILFTWIEHNFKDFLVSNRECLNEFVQYLIIYHNLLNEAEGSVSDTQQIVNQPGEFLSNFRIMSYPPDQELQGDVQILIANRKVVYKMIKSDRRAVTEYREQKEALKFHGYCEVNYRDFKLQLIKAKHDWTNSPEQIHTVLRNTIRRSLWNGSEFMYILVDAPTFDIGNYIYLTLLLKARFTALKSIMMAFLRNEELQETIGSLVVPANIDKRYGIVQYFNEPFLPAQWIGEDTTLKEILEENSSELFSPPVTDSGSPSSSMIESAPSSFSKLELSEEEEEFITSCKFSDPKHQHELRRLLAFIENPDTPILLRGDTGVGKSFIASNLHRHSSRKDKPFVHINCAAITSSLLDAELFGAERGSFTGASQNGIKGKIELAEGGILFLDELTEADEALQTKLLTYLDDKHYFKIGGDKSTQSDVCLIFAFNRDLNTVLRERRLREDLYHRISYGEFVVPPLRERKNDLEEIIRKVFENVSEAQKLKDLKMPKNTLKYLKNSNFPGNFRGIKKLLTRSVTDCRLRKIDNLDLEIVKENYLKLADSEQLDRLEKILEEFFNIWMDRKDEILQDENYSRHFINPERDANYIDGFLKPILANMFIKRYGESYNRKDVFKAIGMSWEKKDSPIVKSSEVYPIIKKYFS